MVDRLREVGCAVDRGGEGRGGAGGRGGPGGVRSVAGRAAAVLAARPDRPERPGRRGDQARGIREDRDRRCRGRPPARAGRPPSGCASRSPARWPAPATSRCSAPRSARRQTWTGCCSRPTIRAGTPCTLANPIRDEEPLLRTSLLPGLLRVAVRNAGRGFADLALFEMGNVARLKPGDGRGRVAPILPVDRRPTPAEIAELDAALPDQPRLVSARADRAAGAGGLVGPWPPGLLQRRDRGRAHGAADGAGALHGQGGPPRALAPWPLRRVPDQAGRVRHRRAGRGRRGRAARLRRLRRRAAPQGHRRVPAARRAPAPWSST